MEEKSDRRHIVIFRFSALGDVAIAAPLVKAYAVANPSIKFTMVSRPMLEPLFKGLDNLVFYPAQLNGLHKGVKGMVKLWSELRNQKVTHVADFHSVLRTHILRVLFFFSFVRVAYLRKGRAQKAALTRKNNKKLEQLPSTMERYEQVFKKLGLEFLDFSNRTVVQKKLEKTGNVNNSKRTGNERNVHESIDKSALGNAHSSKSIEFKIGVAPFAKHRGKEWPLEKMEKVIELLSKDKDKRISIFLFGGGAKESALLKEWQKKYLGVTSVSGECSFEQELEVIAKLDLMVCMDSGNMHFASAMGVPVISIWGATHPYLGFNGWGQDIERAIMSPAECRPCSVFGNKECFRGDYICLTALEPQQVANKIFNFFAE